MTDNITKAVKIIINGITSIVQKNIIEEESQEEVKEINL